MTVVPRNLATSFRTVGRMAWAAVALAAGGVGQAAPVGDEAWQPLAVRETGGVVLLAGIQGKRGPVSSVTATVRAARVNAAVTSVTVTFRNAGAEPATAKFVLEAVPESLGTGPVNLWAT